MNPRTPSQNQASKQNGSHSKGPSTPEGKAISSQNAIKHGLRSSRVVLANESQEKYDALLTMYFAEWNPIGQTERDILVQMVNALWRKRRTQSAENGAIDTEMFIQKPDTDNAMPGATPAIRQGDAVISIANANPSANDYFFRAEARLAKLFRTARKDLIEMQTMRLGHAPVLVPQQEPETTAVTNEPEAASNNFKEPEDFAWFLPFIPTAARPNGDRRQWTAATDPNRTDLAA